MIIIIIIIIIIIKLEFVDIVELNKVECKSRVKNSMTSKGNATLTSMPMHGQHHRLLQEEHIDRKTSLTWMKDSRLKGHTEAMVHAIQDQAVKSGTWRRTYIRQLKMISVESVMKKQKPYTIL